MIEYLLGRRLSDLLRKALLTVMEEFLVKLFGVSTTKVVEIDKIGEDVT